MRLLFRKPKAIGKDERGRRYDLPLNKGAGSGFLILLIGLMTFLAVLATAASLTLGAMKKHWISGLENRLTVEIPAQGPDGQPLKRSEVTQQSEAVAGALKHNPAVLSAHILTENEIKDLVSPWLGESLSLNDIPVPGLIAVELRETTPDILSDLKRIVDENASQATLDTHENWLNDLLRFTRTLQFAALALLGVIGVTTATAVAGGVRSRMAIHRADVELLHLMGASDPYIMKQFQRHSVVLALQGGVAGLAAAALALVLVGWLTGRMDMALIPDFRLSALDMALLAALPVAAALLAAFTARRTVLRVLEQMP